MKHPIAFATAALAAALITMSSASADMCRNARVVVQNDSAQTIKVQKIRYLDGCDTKWRTEDVVNKVVAPGAHIDFVEDLEYVGNCAIPRFRLFRAFPTILQLRPGIDMGPLNNEFGPGQWSGVLTPDEGTEQVCNTGVTYSIREEQ